jgi:predicted DNA-binding transcriptional regulator AlpA
MSASSPPSPQPLLRLPAILGDKNAEPPVPPLVPVAKSTWWKWVAAGIAPAPIRIGPRCVAWRAEDIALFMAGNFLANR